MEGVYLEKINSIAYFIESFRKDDFVEIDGNTAIEKSAFAHSNVEKILFKSCSKSIDEKAFEGCKSLTTVIFGELGKDEMFGKNGGTVTDGKKQILKNVKLVSADDSYTIQANAFRGCGKLTTLVLPELTGYLTTLTIKENAFCECEALRTVVALCDTIEFAGNPFEKLGERLTFICKKDSDVAQFASDNGYRTVYVE